MIIFLILLAALILRLINLDQSLWLDEAISVVYSQKYNFWDFVTVYSLGDFHPPLYFGILWIWTRIFETSEIAVRIPSVIFGVLTIWFTYLIGRNLFSKKIGLVAALILALNPLHLYYSQEARMYSLAAFSVTFSFWALVSLLKNKKISLLFYGLSVALILYSDYLVYFALVAQFLFVIWEERQKMQRFLVSGVLGILLWLPWLLIFPAQLKTGQGAAAQIPGWAGVVGGANLKELGLLAVKSIIGRVSFDNKYLYAAVIAPVLLLYAVISFKALNKPSKEVRLILLWILIPVFLAFVISFYIPIFVYFRMIFILPALSLLLAHGTEKFKKSYSSFLMGILLICSSVFLLMYYLNPQFQREDWKGAVSFVVNENKPGKLILFEDSNIPAPFTYYYPCMHGKCIPVEPGLKNFPAASMTDLYSLDETLTNTRLVIYIFDYLVEISDPNRLLVQKIENLGFKLSNTYNFNGVGFVYEYSK